MRLDELPQNQLVTDIKELEREAQALKNRQFVSGAYNVQSYLNQRSPDGEWDYDLTLGTIGDPSGHEHQFGIYFYADTKFAFGTPFMDIFIDGVSESNRLSQASPVYTGVNGQAVLGAYCEYIISYFDNTIGQFGWYTQITVFGQVQVKVKYFVRSPNTGQVLRAYTAL